MKKNAGGDGFHKTSNQRNVQIKLLPPRLDFDAQPTLLMLHGIGGKRAEAAQWYMEIRKLYIGIIDSIDALEKMMNHQDQNQKITVDGKEVTISPEKADRAMTYLIENAIFRLFACLDKYAQMVRVYYDYPKHGGPFHLSKCNRCGRALEQDMVLNENNCHLVSMYNASQNQSRNAIIDKTINDLYKNKHIENLRLYRNGIAHRVNSLNNSVGLSPLVKASIGSDGMKTLFTFKGLPTINWFRVEITYGLNSIVDSVNSVKDIMFPPDVSSKIIKKGVPSPEA
jgi:hypothetical protein